MKNVGKLLILWEEFSVLVIYKYVVSYGKNIMLMFVKIMWEGGCDLVW